MKRYGMVLGVRPEKLEEYKRLHAAVWPEIIRLLEQANVRNYSIFQKDELLFSYFSTGSDRRRLLQDERRADRQAMVRRLLALPGPACHAQARRWWAAMDEVFLGLTVRRAGRRNSRVAKIERVESMVDLKPK